MRYFCSIQFSKNMIYITSLVWCVLCAPQSSPSIYVNDSNVGFSHFYMSFRPV